MGQTDTTLTASDSWQKNSTETNTQKSSSGHTTKNVINASRPLCIIPVTETWVTFRLMTHSWRKRISSQKKSPQSASKMEKSSLPKEAKETKTILFTPRKKKKKKKKKKK